MLSVSLNKTLPSFLHPYTFVLQNHMNRKEGNVYLRRTQHILFTVIWCQTYGKGPFREWERKPAAATWATLSDFYMHNPTDRIAHTTACVTPVVEHWLELGNHMNNAKVCKWWQLCKNNGLHSLINIYTFQDFQKPLFGTNIVTNDDSLEEQVSQALSLPVSVGELMQANQLGAVRIQNNMIGRTDEYLNRWNDTLWYY